MHLSLCNCLFLGKKSPAVCLPGFQALEMRGLAKLRLLGDLLQDPGVINCGSLWAGDKGRPGGGPGTFTPEQLLPCAAFLPFTACSVPFEFCQRSTFQNLLHLGRRAPLPPLLLPSLALSLALASFSSWINVIPLAGSNRALRKKVHGS